MCPSERIIDQSQNGKRVFIIYLTGLDEESEGEQGVDGNPSDAMTADSRCMSRIILPVWSLDEGFDHQTPDFRAGMVVDRSRQQDALALQLQNVSSVFADHITARGFTTRHILKAIDIFHDFSRSPIRPHSMAGVASN